MPYQFDFYISYRRQNPVYAWVHDHFYPALKEWLTEELGRVPTIFMDTDQIVAGTDWSLKLKNALLSSAILIPVLSATYFSSDYCVCEWRTMGERERLLGLRTARKPSGVRCPVLFYDGHHLPKEAHDIQWHDLSRYAYTTKAFAQSLLYLEFIDEVKRLTAVLAASRKKAPRWRSNLPFVMYQAQQRIQR